MSTVLWTPKWPIKPPSWASLINNSHKELLGIHNLLSLNKNALWAFFSHNLYNLEKSLSQANNSYMWSNPSTLVPSMKSKEYLLERVAATTLALPCLCLITYENCSKNSTHLACCLREFCILDNIISCLRNLWYTVIMSLFISSREMEPIRATKGNIDILGFRLANKN